MAAPYRRNIIAGLAGLTAFGLGAPAAWANQPAKKSIAKPTPPPKPKLVFLDPGHGGRDPGALGVRGTQEKVVVMAIARELQRELQAGGRYRVLLTRASDSFVALRERVARAQAAKADLFLSLARRFPSRLRRARRLGLYAVGGGERSRGRGAGGPREPRRWRRRGHAARPTSRTMSRGPWSP